MHYFYIEPEVAGSLGDRTIADWKVHPPLVSVLHYEFQGWLGDEILESFPVFIVTHRVKEELMAMGVTGTNFDDVYVTTSINFREFHPDRDMPQFVWLKPVGKAGQDDFATANDSRLVVSKRALDVLRTAGASHALIEPFDGQVR